MILYTCVKPLRSLLICRNISIILHTQKVKKARPEIQPFITMIHTDAVCQHYIRLLCPNISITFLKPAETGAQRTNKVLSGNLDSKVFVIEFPVRTFRELLSLFLDLSF